MSTPSRDGERIARLFRQSRGLLDVRACDLDAILEDRQLETAESRHLEPGYSAFLYRAGDGGGIMLAAGQPPGRRRFSIAHELGHFLIPSHDLKGISGYCLNADMRARSHDVRQVEWEANDFAAELLMPKRLFREDASRFVPSVTGIERLASVGYYNVSRLAAAWRYVQLTAHAVAVVIITGGHVSWIVRSDAFRLPLTERNQPIHQDTFAAAAARGEGTSPEPIEAAMGAWLDREHPVAGRLFESTYVIPTLDQIVSVLWHDMEAAVDD